MRRASTPAIPPSLYRHFAIVTLVVTAGLAVFAEGDNREARAAQVAQVRPDARSTAPIIARAAPTTATDSSSGGWDEVDFDSSFGAPMEGPLGDSGVNSDREEVSPPVPPREGPATLNSMEREVLLRGLRDHGTLAPDA